jgi:hypothetical protein
MAGGTGPAASHGPLAGAAVQGIEKVKTGLKFLNDALPMLPMGGDLHVAVAKAVSEMSKHMQEQNAKGGDNIQQLLDGLRNAKTQPNMAAMMPPGGAGGAPPPPMPMGGAPPPPGM